MGTPGMNTANLLRDKPLFGLDVGHGSLKVMQTVQQKSGKRGTHLPRIRGYGTAAFDASALDDGVIKKPEATNLKVAVEGFLRRIAILPWDSEAACHYAELRAALQRTGQPIANLDLMIAAQALAAGAILVTSDSTLRRLKQLRTQDWTRT